MKQNRFSGFVVKYRYVFLGIFFAMLVASGVLLSLVKVNYDLTEYLPNGSNTKESIALMEQEFGATGTSSVMISNISEDDAKEYAKDIESLESVSTAVVSRYQEKDGVGYALVSVFLVNGDYTQEAEYTLMAIEKIFTGEGGLSEDQHYYMVGSAETAVSSRNAILGEIPIILLVAVLIVLGVLLITTRSWFEPLIFLIVIGSAILINMGTNFFLGSISFISNSISSILLIALAMDYSIVLVNRFREEREKEPDVYVAMKKALSGSIVTIIASGLTVMAGLAALMFMNYKIGLDIGLVLTKGVFISLLAVIFLMPAVLLLFSKVIKKTEHKNFLGGLKRIGTFAKKTMWVMPILFLGLMAGAFAVEQTKLDFDYAAKFSSSGQLYQNEQKVKEVFGEQNSLVLLFKTKNGDEVVLSVEDQVELFNNIKSIQVDGQDVINASSSFMTSSGKVYSEMKGEDIEIFVGQKITANYIGENFIPANTLTLMIDQMIISDCGGDENGVYVFEAIEFLGQEQNKQTEIQKVAAILLQAKEGGQITELEYNLLTYAYIDQMIPLVASKYAQIMQGEDIYNSNSYTRMIFNINAEPESTLALSYIQTMTDYLNEYKEAKEGFTYNIVSNSQNVLETQEVFKSDRLRVDLIAAFAILLICALAFRSCSIPVLLVAIIEGSIFINLAGNALLGNSIFFICYLLGTAIQMGATIDYGILLCDRYKEARRTQNKFDAIKTAIDKSFATILSSGTILTLAAFTIGIFSSVPLIKSIGYLIGFGALTASISILFVLPQILLLLDKFISKTTWKANFLFEKKDKQNKKAKVVETTAEKIEK